MASLIFLSLFSGLNLLCYSQQIDTVWVEANGFEENPILIDSILNYASQENAVLLDSTFQEKEWHDITNFYKTVDTLVRESLNLEPAYLIVENELTDRRPVAYFELPKENEIFLAIIYNTYSSDGSFINSRVFFYIRL